MRFENYFRVHYELSIFWKFGQNIFNLLVTRDNLLGVKLYFQLQEKWVLFWMFRTLAWKLLNMNWFVILLVQLPRNFYWSILELSFHLAICCVFCKKRKVFLRRNRNLFYSSFKESWLNFELIRIKSDKVLHWSFSYSKIIKYNFHL